MNLPWVAPWVSPWEVDVSFLDIAIGNHTMLRRASESRLLLTPQGRATR